MSTQCTQNGPYLQTEVKRRKQFLHGLSLYYQTLTQLDYAHHLTFKLYLKRLADFNNAIADLSRRKGEQLSAAGKEENMSSQMGFETKGRIKVTLSPVVSKEQINVIKQYQNNSFYLNSIIHFCVLIQLF